VQNTKIGDSNRRQYTSLVRAQLSADELALLFYNGISSWGEKFRPLILKYDLLENLDPNTLLNAADVKFYGKDGVNLSNDYLQTREFSAVICG
jgi:hypothetical protein